MSSNYDLDEAQAESFEFKLGGHLYKFRYPTVEESEEMANLKDEEGKRDDKAITEKMYSLITPSEKDAPPFNEAIRKVTAPVLKAFSNMLTKELGLE